MEWLASEADFETSLLDIQTWQQLIKTLRFGETYLGPQVVDIQKFAFSISLPFAYYVQRIRIPIHCHPKNQR